MNSQPGLNDVPARISAGARRALSARFPHLQVQAEKLASTDDEFLSLCVDYAAIVELVQSSGDKDANRRNELSGLKASLELEILERLSRSMPTHS